MALGLYHNHIIMFMSHPKTYLDFTHFTSHYTHIHLKYLHLKINVLKMQ